MERKVRSCKVTERQQDILLNYMTSHQEFSSGKISATFSSKSKQKCWEELAAILNSDGKGPARGVDKWKKTWADWKCATRAKCLRVNKHMRGTGGGGALKEKWTSLEERLMQIIGNISALGEESCI